MPARSAAPAPLAAIRRVATCLVAAVLGVAGPVAVPVAAAAAPATAGTCWSYRTVERATSADGGEQLKFQARWCADGRRYARIQFCNLVADGKSDTIMNVYRRTTGTGDDVPIFGAEATWPRARSCTSMGGVRVYRYHSYQAWLTYEIGSSDDARATIRNLHTPWWYFA